MSRCLNGEDGLFFIVRIHAVTEPERTMRIKNDTVTSFTLPDRDRTWLRFVAQHERTTVSELVRSIITREIRSRLAEIATTDVRTDAPVAPR
jgi:hypothetical protein